MLHRFTRIRLVALAAVLSLLGLTGAVAAHAATSAAAPRAALSSTERGWCVRSGTGELRNLWLEATTHRCPDPYWGPTNLGSGTRGPAGPAGPAGPKGDPGNNSVLIKTATVTLDATHITRNFTVSGMPAYVHGAPETVGSFTSTLPSGITVSTTPTAPTAGSTSRDFAATASAPLTGSQTVTVTAWALAVKLPG